MKKRKKHRATLYITNLPVDVKLYFKAYCAKRGKTMTDVITQMMKDKILDDWKEGKTK